MNIVLLVGSERENSRTNIITKKIIQGLKDKFHEEADIQVFDQTNLKAKHCVGCCSCFRDGECIFKEKDGIEELKEALMASDLIYIISPVYFHQVSGTMKVFIDRLSYWTHLFKLIGKVAVTVSVSSNNGNEFVDFYLNKFMSYMGAIVISDISILIDEDTEAVVDKKIEESMCEVYEKLYVTKDFKVTQKQEVLFSFMKRKYESINVGFEQSYWKDNHYFQYSTFQSLWKSGYKEKELV